MGLFSTTTPARNRISARLRAFWFKVWGLLIPVIVRVLALVCFLLNNEEIFFVTGIEYLVAESLIILVPLIVLGFIVKDSLTLLYTTRMRLQADMMVKVIGSQWY